MPRGIDDSIFSSSLAGPHRPCPQDVKMRSVILEGKENLAVRDIAIPSVEAGGMLLKVLACGICGSDVRTFLWGHEAFPLPRTLGHEITGAVVHVNGPTGYGIGDRVAVGLAQACGDCKSCRESRYDRCSQARAVGDDLPGGFAEFVALPAWAVRNRTLVHVPESLTDDIATLAEPLGCVLNAQERLDCGPGDTVLVVGLGPLGLMHVLVARARGVSKVIAADLVVERVEAARAFRPDVCVISGKQDLAQVIARETSGEGVDVVIVACANGEMEAQAVELAATGGRISFFAGLPPGQSPVALDANRIHYKELSVIGAFGCTTGQMEDALNLIAADPRDFERLITHCVPLEEAESGFRLAANKESLRVVLKP